MGSMAFWYEKNNKNATSQAQLSAVMNFNLWTQCDSSATSFLDIGFLISNLSVAKKLYYYIPFQGEVKDLSDKINNTNAIGAIFNEKYSVVDLNDTQCFWPVHDEGQSGKTAFVIYSWNTHECDNAVTTSNIENDGVCVEIDAEKIISQVKNITPNRVLQDDVFYFRFRIEIPDPKAGDTLVRRYTPSNGFLQSTLATTYIVDFRFNDLRSLPGSVRNRIGRQGNGSEFVDVSKLHFLLMTKAHVDVETGAKDISLRELETGTWDEYICKRFETRDVVAYHCAEKKKNIRQWEFFAKLKVNNSTWKVVLIYLLALGIITITFNIISNLIWNALGFLFGT